MFIDNPTIPVRLEVLLDVAYQMRSRNFSKETVQALLQPTGLPDLGPDSKQASHHIDAAEQLRILARDESGNLRFTKVPRGPFSAREAIVNAFEAAVLSDSNVEPWVARFYSFVLSQVRDMVPSDESAAEALLAKFREEIPRSVSTANPMNRTKLRNYLRWYQYVGLGWFDPAGNFIPDPTARIERALASICGKSRSMESNAFIQKLGQACPELDAGSVFAEMNRSSDLATDRTCTRGVAIALRALEKLDRVRLMCPADSVGWSLRLGGQVRTGTRSDRFDRIEIIA